MLKRVHVILRRGTYICYLSIVMQGANRLLFVNVLTFVVSSGENNIVVANTITFVKTCLMDNIAQHTVQHISLQHM